MKGKIDRLSRDYLIKQIKDVFQNPSVEIVIDDDGTQIAEHQPTEESSESHKKRWETATRAELDIVHRILKTAMEQKQTVIKFDGICVWRRLSLAGKLLIDQYGILPEHIKIEDNHTLKITYA